MPWEDLEDGLRRWSPNPGPQTRFLESPAFEVMYGGAAGGGKSEALLMDALRDAYVPGYRALLLRRTFKELERSLIPRSVEYYSALPGAEFNQSKYLWTFHNDAGRPTGMIEFGHCEYESDVENYKSAEYQKIGFDELTSFTRYIYRTLLSRLRSSRGLRSGARSATNPGGVGHDWVLEDWAPWLVPPGFELPLGPYQGPTAQPGEILYYLSNRGEQRWVPAGTPRALSRVFIPAKLEDNPVLMQNDPDYEQRLEQLDPITAAQQRHGDWLIKPAPGLLFKRSWVTMLDSLPTDVDEWVRFWDLAATDEKKAKDPDWTCGVLMGRRRNGRIVVADDTATREDPGGVEQLVLNTSTADRELLRDGRYKVRMAQDPGQAGKAEARAYAKLLGGFDFDAMPATGDKVTNFKPFSAQAKQSHVDVVRGPWNARWFQFLEAFPQKGVHDDDVDGTSGAYNEIAPSARGDYLRRMAAAAT